MPTATYIALANYTTSDSSDAEIVFSSIPQTYRDLVIVYNGETVNSGNFDLELKMNGDYSTYTSNVVVYNTLSFSQNSGSIANFGATNRTTMIAHILDYSATDKHKTALIRTDAPATGTSMAAMRYGQTTALTSVNVSIGSGTFAGGSTFALYGIAS